jgi:predicted nuclease of predicted toxin-antitoxin system
VLYVAEMDPGISDEKVLAAANDINALLLTTDKDFGELVYRLRRISAGVLLIRLGGRADPEIVLRPIRFNLALARPHHQRWWRRRKGTPR